MEQATMKRGAMGISSPDAVQLLKQHGYNEIPQHDKRLLSSLIKNFVSPISFMLMLASILSFSLDKVFDGYFILFLLFLNIAITLWQESKADNAIKKLNEHLEQKIKVFRDGKWEKLPSRLLVQGDLIQLALGDVVPADGEIIEATHVEINESPISGESLPKEKKQHNPVFSGSFLSSGKATIKITATGVHTRFGKTLFSVERMHKQSLLEKDIISISKFLTILSIGAVTVLTIVFLYQKVSIWELLTLDLSLIIAGVPISLPTVMTLIIEFGVFSLAKEDVIVRRLSALEDLANVNFLLTDKTGTLTKNKITVQDMYTYDGFTHSDLIAYASLAASMDQDNPINSALLQKAKELQIPVLPVTKIDLIPADSKRKRTTLFAEKNNSSLVISVGAPQIIQKLCTISKGETEKYIREVTTLGEKGYRTLAVARGVHKKEESLHLVGLIALSDTLREDAKSVVAFLKQSGIGISMVTGDNRAIATTIAKELNLSDGKTISKEQLDRMGWQQITSTLLQQTGAFAEILPEDKLHLVQKAKEFFIVAANGDGVNDLPAIKAAQVGIAVKNAVTALKATADIVLLSEGISVIRDALIESRKIFARLYTYSLYRISESLRLIVTIAILGIIYRFYPLTALQIIVVALLNDIPIISLASDRVHITSRPAKINAKKRFTLSSLYGLVGIANSLILFFIMNNLLHLSLPIIQTIYFLKLTVSGHMLIYVAHTKQRWWKFLPSSQVIWATSLTQLIASLLAFTGFLMPSHISLFAIVVVWVWSFFWMQIGEGVKWLQKI